MNILTIPMRNLRRKLLRTSVLVAVFTAGILSVVMLYYVSRTVGENLEQKLTEFGANIVIYPKSDTLNVSYGGFSLGNLSYQVKYLQESKSVDVIRNIKNKENISTVAPKLVEMTQLNGEPMAIIGVNWEQEQRIKSYWHVLGTMPEKPEQVLVGAKVAEHLNIGAGAEIPVGNTKVVVSGVLEGTGSDDDNMVFADLHFLQTATDRADLVNFIEVSALCAGCPIEEIVQQIEEGLPNTDINALQNIVKQRMYTVHFVKSLVLGVSGIILVIACFMLAMFMMTAVNERKKEIGILRSMGYSSAKIFSIFSFEALLIGAAAGIAGFIGGFFSSGKLLEVLDMAGEKPLAFEPGMFVAAVVVVAFLSILAAAVPALKAARIQPTDAIVQL